MRIQPVPVGEATIQIGVRRVVRVLTPRPRVLKTGMTAKGRLV